MLILQMTSNVGFTNYLSSHNCYCQCFLMSRMNSICYSLDSIQRHTYILQNIVETRMKPLIRSIVEVAFIIMTYTYEDVMLQPWKFLLMLLPMTDFSFQTFFFGDFFFREIFLPEFLVKSLSDNTFLESYSIWYSISILKSQRLKLY